MSKKRLTEMRTLRTLLAVSAIMLVLPGAAAPDPAQSPGPKSPAVATVVLEVRGMT